MAIEIAANVNGNYVRPVEQQLEKLIKPKDLVDCVKASLFDAILTGKLKPGDKLRQEQLAETLGVSRQPVSHALRILADQGILTNLGRKSLTVAELDQVKMMQILDVRIELDSFAAELAAKRSAEGAFGAQDLASIEQLKDLIGQNRNAPDFDVKQSVHDDILFHSLIRCLSGNPFIHETLAPHLLHHQRLIYLVVKIEDPEIWMEHSGILDTIIAGDAKSARSLVRAHIERGASNLRCNWERR